MKKEDLPVEFLYQLFALIVATIVVHAFYVTVVRPQADVTIAEQRLALETDETYVPDRSFYVLIRDFEQEACLILLLWAISIMAYKAWRMNRERSLLQRDLIPLSEGISILPEDTREISRPVQALGHGDRGLLLPRTLLTALHRFRSTRNIQDVSTSVRTACEAEAERLDSELSMVRYIAWAIPSIGFIGTVRGIGEALGQAHNAVQGDITGVTESLGVAFNSTFTALVYSIILMFLLHQLQLFQERLVIETQDYCDEHLISRLQTR
ncbi:MAG: MotA/TolQ/ExbB proton channel family protein [Pseudomonadota bacterium]